MNGQIDLDKKDLIIQEEDKSKKSENHISLQPGTQNNNNS